MSTMKQLLKELVGVEIELDGVSYPNSYAEDLSIDRTNLDGEFTEHAERYAYYATLAEMAEDKHVRTKEDLDNLTAYLDHEKRDAAKAIQMQDPKFKMTETMVENEVRLDARYQGKLKEVQDARHLAKVLKNAPMAFAHRRDMLIEIGKSHNAGLYDTRVTSGKKAQVAAIMSANRGQAPSLPPPVTVPQEDESPPDLNGIAPTGSIGGPPEEETNSKPAVLAPPPGRRRAPRSA